MPMSIPPHPFAVSQYPIVFLYPTLEPDSFSTVVELDAFGDLKAKRREPVRREWSCVVGRGDVAEVDERRSSASVDVVAVDIASEDWPS
jgi:hypothetical protein